MKRRLPFLLILGAAILAWWVSDHAITPWIRHLTGFDRIPNRDLVVILAHWFFDQLPRVLICAGVWVIGTRLGLMPSLLGSLGSGGSWRRVAAVGAMSAALMLALTVCIGLAVGGTLGFHPYVPKMLGDLLSNLYEEIVYRGLMFCAFYGVGAAAAFPLTGTTDRAGLVTGTLGSCFIFAASHTQYSIALRVILGVLSVIFAFAWVRTRSLWGPWIPHTVVDVVGDSILKL